MTSSSASRSGPPIGRYGGTLKALTAAELGEIALRGLLDRTGLDPAAFDDVILGHCYPNSEGLAAVFERVEG